MVKVKLVMMEKDEVANLQRWLSHYGPIFGYENLYIMDNGSTNEETLNLLNEYRRWGGINVIYDRNTTRDFHTKGIHFTHLIRSWDAGEPYDFALPLDCDEIIAVLGKGGISTDKTDILCAFEGLRYVTSSLGTEDCPSFRLDMSLFNVPGKPGWFCPVRAPGEKGIICSSL
jgi:hypothetical protein